MREQVQSMGAKQAALAAQAETLRGEARHWRSMWEQSASANHDLTQRLAACAIDRQVCSNTSPKSPPQEDHDARHPGPPAQDGVLLFDGPHTMQNAVISFACHHIP